MSVCGIRTAGPARNRPVHQVDPGSRKRRPRVLTLRLSLLTLRRVKPTLLVFATSLLVATGCSDSSSEAGTPSGATDETAPAYLFIVDTPESAVVAGDTGLELVVPADRTATWFTDRPVRLAGTFDLVDLVGSWEEDGFAADPPEAAMVVTEDDGDDTFVVELGTPVEADGSIRFPLIEVTRDDGANATHAGRTANAALVAGEYGEMAMFIESTNDCSICAEAQP